MCCWWNPKNPSAAAPASNRTAALSLSSVIPAKAGIQGPPSALLAKLQAQSATLPHLLGTTCVGLYEQAREALLIGPEGPITLAFEALVVATGAYDRLPSFAGNDLPGIIGLRAFERLMVAGRSQNHGGSASSPMPNPPPPRWRPATPSPGSRVPATYRQRRYSTSPRRRSSPPRAAIA